MLAANDDGEVRCRCGARPRLSLDMLNTRTGGALRLYKCRCGEQVWIEHPVQGRSNRA